MDLPALKMCPALVRLSLTIDIWPWPNEGAGRTHPGNVRTFTAALSVLASAVPTLREIELALLLRYNALSVPRSAATPQTVIARVRELPWERLGALLDRDAQPSRTRALERVCMQIDRNLPTERGPWLWDELKEVLDGMLPSRVAELMYYPSQ